MSNVGEDGLETHLLEVDDFHQIADKGEAHYGMMQSGGEEKIIKELVRIGSLDPDGNPIGSNSPTVNKNSAPLEAVEEEKKEWTSKYIGNPRIWYEGWY